MPEIKATSSYLNQEKRQLQEAQIIAIYDQLDKAVNFIFLAHNTADPDKMYDHLTRAEERLNKAREMSIDCER